jgi:hypothetical protein
MENAGEGLLNQSRRKLEMGHFNRGHEWFDGIYAIPTQPFQNPVSDTVER